MKKFEEAGNILGISGEELKKFLENNNSSLKLSDEGKVLMEYFQGKFGILVYENNPNRSRKKEMVLVNTPVKITRDGQNFESDYLKTHDKKGNIANSAPGTYVKKFGTHLYSSGGYLPGGSEG